MMPPRYRVAAVQLNAGADKARNLERAEGFVREAAANGAQLVVLPEVFFWRGPSALELEAAEPIPGPTIQRLAALAEDQGIYLLAGSILERSESSLPFNTSVLLDPRGTVLARYRKIHLFDVQVPGRVEMQESARRCAGSEIVVAATPLGHIGLAICYDLRFPELFRQMVTRGAQIIALPSAFTFVTGAAHWEVLLRARAIENQVYVIAPNQIGRAEGGVENFGHSMIVDPWGVVLAQAPDQECVIYADVDLQHLTSIRTQLPALEHRRIREV